MKGEFYPHFSFKIRQHKFKNLPANMPTCHIFPSLPPNLFPQVTKRIGPHHHSGTSIPFITKLLGGWTTHLKNMRKSNWIISPRIGVKITKVFDNNHQPVSVYFIIQDSFHEKTLPDPNRLSCHHLQIAPWIPNCVHIPSISGRLLGDPHTSVPGFLMLREVNKNDYPP